MKGVVYTKMGTPDVLKVMDVTKPVPTANQILVKVVASSLNANDYVAFEAPVKEGKVPALFKIKEKLKDKKVGKILGSEVAGIVEKVGENVTSVKAGDEVYGIATGLCGAWAEYACIDESESCHKPINLSFEEASTVPIAGTTALAAIRKANIKAGQEVLVYGASGGVGQYAVQLLKNKGAIVTGVCSTRNIEMLYSLGADEVIDYKKEDFSRNNKLYDVIIAINGYNPISKYKKCLKPNGVYVAVGGPLQGIEGGLLGPIMSLGSKKKLTFSTYFTEIKKGSLSFLKSEIEQGRVKPIIDKIYPMEEISVAIQEAIIDHPKGKYVIAITSAK